MPRDPDAKSKHELKREATRARLIQLGLEKMPVKGFSSTSIRDIVAGSELTIGAFHYHFASKEEFFLTLLTEHAATRGAFADIARRSQATTTMEAVLDALGGMGSETAMRGDWTLALGDFGQAIRADPQARVKLADLYAYFIDELGAMIEVMAERGLVRTDLDARTLAAMAFAAIEGHIFHNEVYGAPLDGVLEAVTRILQP
ncbi:MAG: TetR/AcrR family transcriptional regulator [Nocardioides sp.]|uniref:TetR/AcrR family transcriptional regulator n=1 Tax=Nocardioides sp. TaxID=35761 RepID=UPI0039E39946